ncbi:unnamed protein product, partial [Nesidiocoris tenuis]
MFQNVEVLCGIYAPLVFLVRFHQYFMPQRAIGFINVFLLVFQNLSLWNIIQDASVVRGEDALTKFSAKYSSQLEKYDPSVDETEFLRQLEQITQLLENSDPKALLAFQDYAASKRVDRIVLEIARRKESTSSILEPSLGFIALCYKGIPNSKL